jgi:hypothetical protein
MLALTPVGRQWVQRCRDHDTLLAVVGEEQFTAAEAQSAWESLNQPEPPTAEQLRQQAVIAQRQQQYAAYLQQRQAQGATAATRPVPLLPAPQANTSTPASVTFIPKATNPLWSQSYTGADQSLATVPADSRSANLRAQLYQLQNQQPVTYDASYLQQAYEQQQAMQQQYVYDQQLYQQQQLQQQLHQLQHYQQIAQAYAGALYPQQQQPAYVVHDPQQPIYAASEGQYTAPTNLVFEQQQQPLPQQQHVQAQLESNLP